MKKLNDESKRLLILFAALHILHPAFSAAAGKTTAEFLKLGAGARAGALGGAYSAMADDPTALYWNPASLTQIQGSQASFMHALYIESSFFDHLAYAHSFQDAGTLGLGLQYFSAGSIPQTDETGSESGTFTPNDLAVSLGYGLKFENLGGLSLGVNAKLIQSKIIDSANTAALDLGALSPAFIDEKIKLGFSVSNLGGQIKFGSTSESLPLMIRLGSSLKILDSWSASLDLEAPQSDKTSVALGSEYRLDLSAHQVALRAGLNSKTLGEIGGFTGFAFGLGWKASRLSIDYAIAPLGDLGMNHRASIGVKF